MLIYIFLYSSDYIFNSIKSDWCFLFKVLYSLTHIVVELQYGYTVAADHLNNEDFPDN